MPTKKATNELKRHTLSLRLDDVSHDLITTQAWKRRTNCSELIRSITLEQLKQEEAKAAQPQTV